jgi:hypothetical protein
MTHARNQSGFPRTSGLISLVAMAIVVVLVVR